MMGALFRPLLGAFARRSFAERERRRQRQRMVKLLADAGRRRTGLRRALPLPR
ncbi:MAG TPA: hypothetical protein VEU32_08515 [Burkholderiales bacterium]|nr:hypothetical protein [Burkholderiales bacterium]